MNTKTKVQYFQTKWLKQFQYLSKIIYLNRVLFSKNYLSLVNIQPDGSEMIYIKEELL